MTAKKGYVDSLIAFETEKKSETHLTFESSYTWGGYSDIYWEGIPIFTGGARVKVF